MKKKLCMALGLIFTVLSAFTLFSACGDDGGGGGGGGGGGTNAPQTASDGVLIYTLLPDKSGYSVEKLLDKSYASRIDVPSTIEGLPVKEVASRAFAQTGITNISFGDSLQKVGALAFYSCFDLERVSFPASLEEFAGEYSAKDDITYYHTFFACRSLTSVTFAADCRLKEIPWNAFGCTWLESIRIPAAVERIGENAFCGVRKFPKPHLDSEASGPTDGFDGSFSVSFEGGSGLTAVGDYAFSTTPLREFDMPASVTELGKDVFLDCPYLKA